MTSRTIGRRDFGALALGAVGAAALAKQRPQPGWTSLWNGKDFEGWEREGVWPPE